jgi:hypothetical protein
LTGKGERRRRGGRDGIDGGGAAIRRARRSLLLVGGDGVQEAVALLAERLHQVELGLEEVDVALLVLDELLEEDLGGIVAHLLAMVARLDVEVARVVLGGEVGLQRLLRVSPMRSGSRVCRLGWPSRKMMRAISLSAWCISSMLSSRDFLASLP